MARQKRGYAIAGQHVPIVPAAILFDLANGGDKDWQENPYYQLGIDAYGHCDTAFALGSVGAGKGAMAGINKGGIGSASITVGQSGYVSSHTTSIPRTADPSRRSRCEYY